MLRTITKGIALALLSLSLSVQADIIIVTTSDFPEIDKKLAKRIFLKKTDTLPNGMIVTPIDLTDDSELKWEFYRQVTGKRPAQIHSYWSRAVFSGIDNPPEQVENISELKAKLNQPGTIGYINEEDLEPGMTVLLRISS